MKKSRIELMIAKFEHLKGECTCTFGDCEHCKALNEAIELYLSLDEKMVRINSDYLSMLDDYIVENRELKEENERLRKLNH